MESHKRSIAKTISWRIIATAVTILLAYIWLGEWASSVSLGIAANGLKALLYYLHERGWNLSSWGRVISPRSMEDDKTINLNNCNHTEVKQKG